MKSYRFKVTRFEPLTDVKRAKIAALVEKPYTTGRLRQVNLQKRLMVFAISLEQTAMA